MTRTFQIVLLMFSVVSMLLLGLIFTSQIIFAQGNEDLNASSGTYEMDSAYSRSDGIPASSGTTGSAPANGGTVTNQNGSNPPTGSAQNPRPSSGDSAKLTNPLKSQSIEEFLLKIIDVLLVFALPIIVLYIMYAGYLFVTAQGDSGQVSEARSALLWAVVGGVIILGAKVIVTVIQNTITAF
jgi:hypothetical protein